MTDSAQQSNEITQSIEAWMNMTKSFWKDFGSSQGQDLSGSGFPFNFDSTPPHEDEEKYKTYRTWETSVNNYFSILNLLMAPENREAFMSGLSSLADSTLQSVEDSLENFTDFQKQFVQSLVKVSEHTKAYNYDDLDHTAFESFRELYRSEMQKYLYVPKIGLPREYHEQITQLIDKSNIFNSHLAELIYLFSIPFEKTNRVMQENIKKMLEQGEFNDDFKKTYKEWVAILEGHFMELLQSPEYTKVLNNTITSLSAYKNIKNSITNVFLKDMQIPTNKDMDEVYKDIYYMKKTIKTLTKEVKTLRQELKEVSSK